MFPERRTESDLRELIETKNVTHICIDNDAKATWMLLITIQSKGLTLKDVGEVYGYRVSPPGTAVNDYIFLNEQDHQVMQSLLGESAPCQVSSS